MKNTSLSPANLFGGLMNELLNQNDPRFFRDDFFKNDWMEQHQSVPVNINESNDGYRMEVVAPGLNKEDLKINVDNNMLHISFEKQEESKVEDKEGKSDILRQEFKMKSFKRSFKLDEKIDAEKISAKYENGILYLNIPKKEEVKAANKVIEIA